TLFYTISTLQRQEKLSDSDPSHPTLFLSSANGPIGSPNPPTAQSPTRAQHQNVVVMRDRLEHFEPLWISTVARPWDPPLLESGLSRAFHTGRKFRNNLGFPIHRVFVSPFVRCVQTAGAVISGLFAVADDPNPVTGGSVPIDASKVKVSIEYGICEMLNNEAIQPVSAPRDGDFGFNVSELEGLFPDGTVDRSVEPVIFLVGQRMSFLLNSCRFLD
ncbi:Histidine phosphatase, partial [Parasponia andersonii]